MVIYNRKGIIEGIYGRNIMKTSNISIKAEFVGHQKTIADILCIVIYCQAERPPREKPISFCAA